MEPITTAALVAGGASLLGTGAGIVSNGSMNRKNRKWQEKMYAQQLADERENCQMQNEYNEQMYNKYSSPAAQAQQMLSAGLNPDLQDVSAGVAPQAGQIGSSSLPSVSGQNPFDFVGAFMNIAEMVNGLRSMSLDNELKQAEIDKISRSYAMDYLVKNYNPDPDNTPLVGVSDVLNDTIRGSQSSSSLATYFRKQGLSRRAANLAARFVHTTNVQDVRKEFYSRRFDTESSRKSFLSSVADPFYRSDDNDMVSALNEFLELKPKLDRALFKSQTSKANYDSSYYGSKSGSAVAAHESKMAGFEEDIRGASANASKNSAEIDGQINDLISSIKNPTGQLIVRILYKYLQKFVDSNF